jgi:signal peptide peptidase SppA
MIRKLLSFLPIEAFRNPPAVVSVVYLQGAIMARGRPGRTLDLARLEGVLEAAFGVKGAKAVAVVVNSPGGSAVQASLIHDRIRQLAAEKNLPVYAFAEDVAASGGYMLLLAGDEIYAHPASIVGSIGVIAAGFGFDKAIEKLGVDRRVRTAGTKKGMLDPFSPEKPEEVARLNALLGSIHQFFRDLVVTRRGSKINAADEDLFSGDIWVGHDALAKGLIDGLGEMKSTLRAKFGPKTKFKHFGVERGWLKGRLGLARGGLADEMLDSLEIRELWARFGA